MSDFEQLDNAWEQAEQLRHAALLRQLKAAVGVWGSVERKTGLSGSLT